MDRITKAIELAREKNLSNAEQKVKTVSLDQPASNTRKIQTSEEVLKKNHVLTSFLAGSNADAYRLLRTRVLQRMRQHDWTTLGITSSHPKAGKSLTSINLGIAIALDQNYSSVLVDADMRRPSVHRYFGIEPDAGLVEYISGSAQIDDVMFDVGIERLTVLPCRDGVDGTSELLTLPKMSELVDNLGSGGHGKIAIFDMPPILVGDDVVALSQKLDAVLIVLEDGVTNSDEIVNAMELLKGVNVLGCVLNKSKDVDAQQYGKYY